ncbi:MAG: hypothetical protein KME04_07525 [Pleurocapsa minor GSE-CHR-MK-17-07R]|jgi:hypothetical protein|nr:hypothetical protein [Pleurocapsa minor GSE-CHR-MK 17-07R]
MAGLEGLLRFAPLINAHDHLELNHYPRTRPRDRYVSAHDWGEDVSKMLNEPPYEDLRRLPLADRCLAGMLKNMLCGVGRVVQHNPPHKMLFARDTPTRVEFTPWVHSLHFDADHTVVEEYRRTPKHVPFSIHLAEGTDDRAHAELGRLRELGCLRENTVLIHGVGLTEADIAYAAPLIRGLVCCPTTNLYLLNALPPMQAWVAAGGWIALGSDSRLTADGDLLDEINWAREHLGWDEARLQSSLDAAEIFTLMPVKGADSYFMAEQFPRKRADIALIVHEGRALIGHPDAMTAFSDEPSVMATLDGQPRRLDLRLARKLAASTIHEPGLTFGELPPEKRAWFFNSR